MGTPTDRNEIQTDSVCTKSFKNEKLVAAAILIYLNFCQEFSKGEQDEIIKSFSVPRFP